jgi:hypothetical protein
MKSSATLSESIGSTRGEARGVSVGETDGSTEHVSRTLGISGTDERTDRGSESVAITITSSTGYEDSETFTLRGKRASNAFARRLMTIAIRAYDKRDDDAGE